MHWSVASGSVDGSVEVGLHERPAAALMWCNAKGLPGRAVGEPTTRSPNGHEVAVDARFCPTCGARLESEMTPSPSDPYVFRPAAQTPRRMSGLLQLWGSVWLGLAAAAAMIIGSFAPWATAFGLLNWLVVGAAVLGAGALHGYSRGWRIGALGALLAAAAAAAVTIYAGQTLLADANENPGHVSLHVGWGLNLAMGASVLLGIVGLVALVGNERAPGMTVAGVESDGSDFTHLMGPGKSATKLPAAAWEPETATGGDLATGRARETALPTPQRDLS